MLALVFSISKLLRLTSTSPLSYSFFIYVIKLNQLPSGLGFSLKINGISALIPCIDFKSIKKCNTMLNFLC